MLFADSYDDHQGLTSHLEISWSFKTTTKMCCSKYAKVIKPGNTP